MIYAQLLSWAAMLCCVLVSGQNLKTDYQTPPPILEPETEWYGRYQKSRVGKTVGSFVDADGNADSVNIYRLDLVGNTYERGFAFGHLMAHEIIYFTQVAMSKYFMDMVLGLDVSQFPEPLQEILHVIQIKGAIAAPQAFNDAMAWVYEQEEDNMPSYLIEEMEAIGDGVCNKLRGDCNVTEVQGMIKRFNMLPELIQMACTMFGAWGKASTSGNLMQLRALDFGGGPFSNFTILAVYRSSENDAHAFATIAYPAFVGAITGVSQTGVGISEKVWMVNAKKSLQPGNYQGEPDVFVLRDILQLAQTREEAEAHMQEVNRTWAIFIGVGDYASQRMDVVGYKEDSAVVYTDETISEVTQMPYLESVVYVDKHPQPSDDASLPTALTDFYGSISLDTSRTIIQYHRSGDQHIAMYDFGDKKMLLSVGKINEDGEYGPVGGDLSSWKAYNRPWLQFDLEDLWVGN